MTTYNDFDAWGMEDNYWGGVNGSQDWDSWNIGANTEYNPMQLNNYSIPSGPLTTGNYLQPDGSLSLGKEFMMPQTFAVNNDAFGGGGYTAADFDNRGESWAMPQQQMANGPMPEWMIRPDNARYNTAEGSQWTDVQPGVMDQITSGINQLGGVLGKNKDLLRGVMGLYGSYKNQQGADKQRQLAAQMMSKFGNPNAAMYAAGHKNYYQNPGEWMNSPYVQVPYQQAAKEYMAKMAAQGRTNPNEMAYTQAQMLNDMASKSYNNWMQSSYPWGQENQNLIGPYSNMMTGANANELNKYNGILEWLARMSGIPQSELGITGDKSGEDMKKMFELLLKLRG